MCKVVGIAGLGLIGGSLAKAYKKADFTVLGCDKDEKIQSYTKLAGTIDDFLDEKNLGQCDLVFLALYPAAAVEYVQRNRKLFKKDALVIDCCGVKKAVCDYCFPIAKEEGFVFVGGHPMAGSEKSGFKASRAELFQGASMVIVPPVFDDIRLLARIKDWLKPLGFGKIKVTQAETHDRMIAYTSQLSHIASNAFIKSPTAANEEGFSGGSFRDLTRVAYLNEEMWTELFLYNKEALLEELGIFISSLQEYQEALAAEDRTTLEKLLRDGRQRKESLEQAWKKEK